MKPKIVRTIVLRSFALIAVLVAAWSAQASDAKTLYPSMAALDQYLMERNAEIAWRGARPGIHLTRCRGFGLGRHGYETAVKGKNGFVCLVERGWTAQSTILTFGIPGYAVQSASIRQLRDLSSTHYQKTSPY